MDVRRGTFRYCDEADASGKVIARNLWFWCPGCDQAHRVSISRTDGKVCWTFDGNLDCPTIAPSILCLGTLRCHSYLERGRIRFLSDCGHALKDKTIDMPPLPKWLTE